MKISKVVARFKDGTLLKGETDDFSLDKPYFFIRLMHGDFFRTNSEVLKTARVKMDDLKAAFFVKDFHGNRNRKDKYNDSFPWGSKKVKALFIDGEEITGYALHYALGDPGFFIEPADKQSNNERIFVINSATKEVTFL